MTLTPKQARLADEARRIRDEGALGRSDVLVRLFDFLLMCSLDHRVPKEIEIACEVFDRQGAAEAVEDASVRVYVHRLRRKLDEFYASRPSEERLVIRPGRYQLALAAVMDDPSAHEPAEPSSTPEAAGWRPGRRDLLTGVAGLGAVNLAGWAWWGRSARTDPVGTVTRTSFWRTFDAVDRQVILCVGDYYIFGEAPDTVQVSRLVRQFEINSSEDLDAYLMTHPDQNGHLVDLDLHYLPTSIARALQTLLPLASAVAARHGRPLSLRTMSDLTAEQFKSANIIYLGYLSGLGLLRDPLFEVSGFQIGESYDEIVDRRTGIRYLSDWSKITDGGRQRRDYNYIASVPGPTGNRMLIVAGTRDAALMQAARTVADPATLAALAARTGDAEAIEALFRVNTIGDVDLDSALVVARPLHDTAAWRSRSKVLRFPDQLPATPAPGVRR